MTNYNERLDKIVRNAYRGELSWIHDQLDGTSVLEEALGRVEKEIINTKQAITSIIKELVAEAKPDKKPQFFCQGCDKSEERGYNQAVKAFEQNLLKALEDKK